MELFRAFHTSIAVLCAVTLLCLTPLRLAADEGRNHFHIGFSSRLFPNVPTEDIRAGVHVLARRIAKRIVGSADSSIYDSFQDLERDLRAKKVDALALTAEEFLILRERHLLQPIVLTCARSGYEVSLLLITRNDSGLNRVSDLRNRAVSLSSSSSQSGKLHDYWLETLFLREGYKTPISQILSLRETKSASQALMSVFFRKADACVVTEQTFSTSCELNPQLGRELRVISRIDGLVGGVGAIRTGLPEEQKKIITRAMLTLHEDQEGKQIFTLFQFNRMEPFRPEYLRSTEAFFREYRTLKAKAGKK